MRTRDEVECWLTDMDGVLVHENTPIPGASELLQQWRDLGVPFLVLTNNSIFTPRDLSARLRASGLVVPEEAIWTSALATADFLRSQMPGGSAFVIGEAGLTTALHEAGFIMTETDPDYVVIGETRNYSFEAITKASGSSSNSVVKSSKSSASASALRRSLWRAVAPGSSPQIYPKRPSRSRPRTRMGRMGPSSRASWIGTTTTRCGRCLPRVHSSQSSAQL